MNRIKAWTKRRLNQAFIVPLVQVAITEQLVIVRHDLDEDLLWLSCNTCEDTTIGPWVDDQDQRMEVIAGYVVEHGKLHDPEGNEWRVFT
jgi:hypothetical protein